MEGNIVNGIHSISTGVVLIREEKQDKLLLQKQNMGFIKKIL